MPSGPKGEKRPADVNASAVMIARIATGEIDGHEAGEKRAGAAVGAEFEVMRLADRRQPSRVCCKRSSPSEEGRSEERPNSWEEHALRECATNCCKFTA